MTQVYLRAGLNHRIWKNPQGVDLFDVMSKAAPAMNEQIRGLLTGADLYVWRVPNLVHQDFIEVTGLDGVRLRLGLRHVWINDETAAFPEHFPSIFSGHAEAAEADLEQRREVAVEFLSRHPRTIALYPSGFTTSWYS